MPQDKLKNISRTGGEARFLIKGDFHVFCKFIIFLVRIELMDTCFPVHGFAGLA